tara:strand:- start:5387 stop:6256 length:870 start_codon:yes stop_codon:yes gene_type:complete
MSKQLELHIISKTADRPAIDWLADGCPLSRQQLKQAMHKGAVWWTPVSGRKPQRLRRAKKIVPKDTQLHLYYDGQLLLTEPPPATLLADEGTYSVWHKPYGMLSQGSKWSDHCTLTRWAEQHLEPQRSAYLVHRLDRATSGLMVIAHSKQATRSLTQAFEQRQTDKRYQAIIEGRFPDDEVHCELSIDDKPALSHFQRLDYDEQRNQSLVDIHIETGRKHQIRKHLSALGFPIVGDRLHGRADADDIDLQLCAYQLSFPDPINPQSAPKTYQLSPKQRLTWPPQTPSAP